MQGRRWRNSAATISYLKSHKRKARDSARTFSLHLDNLAYALLGRGFCIASGRGVLDRFCLTYVMLQSWSMHV